MPSDEFVEDCGELVQAVEMGLGQPVHNAVTSLCQTDAHHTAVVLVLHALDQPGRLGAVDELHRAVRPEQQVTG